MARKNPTPTASPRLVVRLGDGSQAVHFISAQQTTVGRDPSNDVCIPDHFVSKFHARILQVGDLFTVRDLGSANQTRVNGEVVQRAVIRHGDRVQFAGIACQFFGPVSQEAAGELRRSREIPRQTLPRGSSPGETRPLGCPSPPPIDKENVEQNASVQPSIGRDRERSRDETSARRRGSRASVLVASLFVLLALVAAWVLRALPSPPSLEASGAARTSELTPLPQDPVGAGEFGDAGTEPPEIETKAAPGRLEEARATLRALLESDPQNPLVRRRLARVEEEIEQAIDRHWDNATRAYEEAVAEWKRVLSLAEPSDRRYREARERVEGAEAERPREADER